MNDDLCETCKNGDNCELSIKMKINKDTTVVKYCARYKYCDVDKREIDNEAAKR